VPFSRTVPRKTYITGRPINDATVIPQSCTEKYRSKMRDWPRIAETPIAMMIPMTAMKVGIARCNHPTPSTSVPLMNVQKMNLPFRYFGAAARIATAREVMFTACHHTVTSLST
jgi:hypothetical protein